MSRGRPAKPTPLHILDGTFREDRHGGIEPQPLEGIPVCPTHLAKQAKEMWKELVKVLGEAGILTKADRNLMAMYCEAYADWRDAKDKIKESGPVLADDNGRMYKNPYRVILIEATSQMTALGASLGLSPSGRTHLKVKVASKTKTVPMRDRSKGPPPPNQGVAT